MKRWLTLGLAVVLSAAACGRKAPDLPLPNADAATPVVGRRLPTPPLDTGHPAPPRTGSAGNLQFDSGNVFAFTDNGETGDKGGGTFAVLPGGEDDLDSAWVIFRIQLAADDRPVSIGLGSAFAALPGGEDDLELSYWLGAYSFSQARWDWLEPSAGSADLLRPGAWSETGSVPVGMNSEQLRQRYCNLGGEVYFCVLVEPKSRTGAWCGVTVTPSTLDFANKAEAGFFKNKPLPVSISAVTPDVANAEVILDLVEGEAGEADRIYVQRMEGSAASAMRSGSTQGWIELGFVPAGAPTYTDPDNNTNPLALLPEVGKTYQYRAVAAVLDGNQALRAAHSNTSTAALGNGGWETVTLANVMADRVSLAVINGLPAVAYTATNLPDANLVYQRAITVEGADLADWRPYVTADNTTTNVGWVPHLVEVNNRPAVAYLDLTNFQVRYAQASTGDGTSGSDWLGRSLAVNPLGEFPAYLSLAVVAGNPAVAYYAADFSFQDLVFVRSDDADGITAWSQRVDVDTTGNTGLYPSLAVIAGNPAISYVDDTNKALRYARCGFADGGSTGGDWTMLNVEFSLGHDYFGTTLIDVAGKPAISFVNGTVNVQRFERSSTVDGMLATDWDQQNVYLTPVSALSSAAGGNFAMVAGRPAIAFYDQNNIDIWFEYSQTADGGIDENTWDPENTGLAGFDYVSLAEVNGKAAIAYADALTHNPTYAILNPGG
jgi:predicted small lipoprotein YifL